MRIKSWQGRSDVRTGRMPRQPTVKIGELDAPLETVVFTAGPDANPYFGLPSEADSQFGNGAGQHVDRGLEQHVEPRHDPRVVVAASRSGDLLLEHQFASQLRREKRRADRSKRPLSVALFRVEGTEGGAQMGKYRLFEALAKSKRETDFLGVFENGTFGVMLTDTAYDGASRYRRKIEQRCQGFRFEAIVRTYPDQLFDELTQEPRRTSAVDPLNLDSGVPQGAAGRFFKRCIDFAGATLAIVLLSPLMLPTALAIRRTSPGPIIYKQVRLGRGGKPFVFYKFRSMYADSDDRIHREYVTSIIKKDEQTPGEGPKAWSKLEHDPRITPVGRFIRKTSIDELPQLFNVLQGHMSLVGPRPPLPYEAAEYESWHLRRIFEVKPGITGLWQVAGRGATTFDNMVRLDIQYIKSWSLGSDIKILLKTVVVVLRRNGAK